MALSVMEAGSCAGAGEVAAGVMDGLSGWDAIGIGTIGHVAFARHRGSFLDSGGVIGCFRRLCRPSYGRHQRPDEDQAQDDGEERAAAHRKGALLGRMGLSAHADTPTSRAIVQWAGIPTLPRLKCLVRNHHPMRLESHTGLDTPSAHTVPGRAGDSHPHSPQSDNLLLPDRRDASRSPSRPMRQV